MGLNPESRRALERLQPGDRARAWAELALETDDPAVTAAVVERLVAEIQHERGARIVREPNRAGYPSS